MLEYKVLPAAVLTVIAGVALGSEVRPVLAQPQGLAPAQEDPRDFRDALNELATKYGVQIVYDQGPYTWDGGRRTARNPADWEIAQYTPVLVDELSLYPAEFVRNSGAKRIILCRDLWVDSEGVNQHISGTLDSGTGTLYLAVDYTYKVNNQPKQRRVFHHAFFHLLDGTMELLDEDACPGGCSQPADPDWKALNPPGFEYGDYGLGGQHDRTSQTGLLTKAYPGFLNLYSAGHIADDKADIFAYLMVVHHYVEDRGRDDDVIQAKIELMKRRLEAFSPDLNASFWARVASIGRDVTPYTTL